MQNQTGFIFCKLFVILHIQSNNKIWRDSLCFNFISSIHPFNLLSDFPVCFSCSWLPPFSFFILLGFLPFFQIVQSYWYLIGFRSNVLF